MSDSNKSKTVRRDMDNTDIQYVVELLKDALRDQEWETVVEARLFLQEYLDDDGGPIELEE
jgi:hypothetical protein